MNISKKLQNIEQSPIRKFNPYALEAEARGIKIYRLNIGQPDIETPPCFMDAIRNYDEKVIAYAESGGVAELQDAICDYFKAYGMDFERDEVMVTNGGSEALTMVFNSILDPGDEIITAEPFYANYQTFVTTADGVIVPMTTRAEDGYDYADAELIESAITDKTRAIICTSPGNPTGRVLSMDDIRLIGELAIKHDLWIVADEVYREFAYDGKDITSFGMVPEIRDRVILIDSVSKRFSACGARVGCIVSKNKDLMDSVMKIAQGRLCCPTLDQIGAAALYRLDRSYYDKAREEYEARRDAVYEELMKIPDIVCRKPGGSFYIMAKLPVDDIEDFLMFLLREFDDNGETVMFSPAEGFYATPGLGKDEIRIAYVLNRDDMRRGVELTRLGLEQYKNR